MEVASRKSSTKELFPVIPIDIELYRQLPDASDLKVIASSVQTKTD